MPGWIGSNWSIQPSSQLSLLLGAENIEVGLADVVLVDVGAQLPLLPHDTCTGVAKDGTTDCGNTAQFHLQCRPMSHIAGGKINTFERLFTPARRPTGPPRQSPNIAPMSGRPEITN